MQIPLIFIKNMRLMSLGQPYGDALSIYSSAAKDGMPWFAYALLIFSVLGLVTTALTLSASDVTSRKRFGWPRFFAIVSQRVDQAFGNQTPPVSYTTV